MATRLALGPQHEREHDHARTDGVETGLGNGPVSRAGNQVAAEPRALEQHGCKLAQDEGAQDQTGEKYHGPTSRHATAKQGERGPQGEPNQARLVEQRARQDPCAIARQAATSARTIVGHPPKRVEDARDGDPLPDDVERLEVEARDQKQGDRHCRLVRQPAAGTKREADDQCRRHDEQPLRVGAGGGKKAHQRDEADVHPLRKLAAEGVDAIQLAIALVAGIVHTHIDAKCSRQPQGQKRERP